jgi:hypothetical protein
MIKRFDDYRPESLGSYTEYKRSSKTSSSWVVNFTSSNLNRGFDREVAWGIDTPHFHERLRKGELLPYTDYTKHVITETPGSFNYTLDNSVYTYNPANKADGVPYSYSVRALGYGEHASFSLADEHSTKWALAQQTLASIYSQGMDALTFLAELRKTLKMVVSKFRQVVTFISSYDFRVPPRWTRNSLNIRTLNSEWLEWRYGWRILLYDLQSFASALDMPYKKARYKERAGYQQTWADTYSRSYSWTASNGYEPYRRSFELNERVMVVGDFYVPPFRFNPFLTAYELVPYSFVFDWFFSLGRAIEAVSLLATVQGGAGAIRKTLVAGFAQSITVTTESNGNPFVATSYNSTYTSATYTWAEQPKLVEQYIRRQPLDLLNPALVMPHFHMQLSPLKVVDALALILQRFYRR